MLISPEELRVPDYIINDVLEANGIEYKETRSLEEVMPELDILYMTRVQKERFFNEEDYILSLIHILPVISFSTMKAMYLLLRRFSIKPCTLTVLPISFWTSLI